jgi:hypothetical protein
MLGITKELISAIHTGIAKRISAKFITTSYSVNTFRKPPVD